MPEVDDYTALLSGNYWNGIEVTQRPVIVTFSFPTSLPPYAASIDGFTADTPATFSAFTETEQAQTLEALNEWAQASGLVFIQVAPGQGDINFQNIDFDTTSYAGAGGIGFYPFGDWDFFSYPSFRSDLDGSGDVFMNVRYMDGEAVNYGTLLHEIGHAIGLKHPTEIVTDSAATPPVVHDQTLSSDDPTRTIMATVGDSSSSADPHLLQLDKDAAAFLYGPAGTGGVYTVSVSASNAVSSWSWDPGTQTLTQTATTTDAVIRGTSVNDVIRGSDGADRLFGLAGNDQLDGGKGNDSLFGGTGINVLTGGIGNDSYYVDSASTTIVENPGEGDEDAVYSTVSYVLPDNVESLSLYGSGLTATSNAQGGSLFGDGKFASTLIGGAGIDYMVGGAGNDRIKAHGGPDLMYGGGGANRFVFGALSDAPIGPTLATIGDFATAQDKLNLAGIKTTGADPGQDLTFIGTDPFSKQAGEVHQVTDGANTIVEGDIDGDGAADFQINLLGSKTLQSSNFVFDLACYRDGTRILTTQGEMPVEDLAIGATVVTASGEARQVEWIGHRRIDCRRHPEPALVWPVRVRANAFAPHQPHRDLFLSPDHAVFTDGLLVPIRHLINGTTIAQVAVDAVTYHHVELARHDLLVAEGLPAESYLDTGNRGSFSNSAEPTALHPDFSPSGAWPAHAFAPLANDEAQVRPVWERLAARAADLGQPVRPPALTDDPDLHIEVDGRLLCPVMAEPTRCLVTLPPRAARLRLLSRAGRPTDSRPWLEDRRRLGVYVSRIVWHDSEGPQALPLDHPALGEGWWDVEHGADGLRRWTDGGASLSIPPGALMAEIHFSGGIAYRLDTDGPSADEAPAIGDSSAAVRGRRELRRSA